MPLPLYIALCGNPGAGKTTAAEILDERFHVTPVDDGHVLREFAVEKLGARISDVATAEGKAGPAYYPDGEPILDVRTGEHMTWRQVLGRIGNQLEGLFGSHIMPRIATANLWHGAGASYSFASVRKDQAAYYKSRGGFVIGIYNPDAPASINPFDDFHHHLVDYWVINDGLHRGLHLHDAHRDLEAKLEAALAFYAERNCDVAA